MKKLTLIFALLGLALVANAQIEDPFPCPTCVAVR
jgi:hypothetical protein